MNECRGVADQTGGGGMRVFLPVLVVIMTVGILGPGTATAQHADAEAMDILREDAIAALKAGDMEALLACFTEDAVVMSPSSSSADARRGLLDTSFLSGLFVVAALTGIDFENSNLSSAELVVSGDWAFERGTYGVEEKRHRGDYIAILRRLPDGSWRIARFIFTPEM